MNRLITLNKSFRRLASTTSYQRYDWSNLLSKLPETEEGDVRETIKGFIARREEVKRELARYGTDPEPIDFDYYRDMIEEEGYVDAAESNYHAILEKMADFRDSEAYKEAMSEIEAAIPEDLKNVRNFMAEKAAEREKLEAELAKLKANRTTYETTIDDVLKLYPEIREEIEEEIANHDYGPSKQ